MYTIELGKLRNDSITYPRSDEKFKCDGITKLKESK